MEDFKPISSIDEFVRWVKRFKFKYEVLNTTDFIHVTFHNVVFTYWDDVNCELTIQTKQECKSVPLDLTFNLVHINFDLTNLKCVLVFPKEDI